MVSDFKKYINPPCYRVKVANPEPALWMPAVREQPGQAGLQEESRELRLTAGQQQQGPPWQGAQPYAGWRRDMPNSPHQTNP